MQLCICKQAIVCCLKYICEPCSFVPIIIVVLQAVAVGAIITIEVDDGFNEVVKHKIRFFILPLTDIH